MVPRGEYSVPSGYLRLLRVVPQYPAAKYLTHAKPREGPIGGRARRRAEAGKGWRGLLDLEPRAYYMALEYPLLPAHLSIPARLAQSGAYSHVSFAIEPIQPPIVPLSLFVLQSLRTNAGA